MASAFPSSGSFGYTVNGDPSQVGINEQMLLGGAKMASVRPAWVDCRVPRAAMLVVWRLGSIYLLFSRTTQS
ncbi:hypothetical protein [Mesorhizobium sp. WSM3626]|uniref:hypothetical protein n=1 Tax=Mesorhizobium sp. WSM3626 TaxID=1040987 RepID=UPI0004AD35D5|nr:hypothetical protein [Mesorhizobium sp. WSM3626]